MIGLEPLPFAIGAALLAVPVILHAITREAPGELPLPTTLFLDAAPEPRRRLSRPRDRFLMLLRCLAVLLFALAAARPFDRAQGAVPERTGTILVLDDSLSMAHGKPVSRLERAKAELARALDGLDPASRAALVLATNPRSSFEDVASVRARLALVEPSARGAPLLGALEAAAALSAGRKSVSVVLASDLDRTALEGIETRSEAARALSLRLVDVGRDEPRNAYLTDVSWSPDPAIAGEPVFVSARVRAVGLDLRGADTVTVALELQGTAVREEHVRTGETVRFRIPAAQPGLLSGALVVRAAGDQLELDDRVPFATLVRGGLRVVVSPGERAEAGARAVASALAAIGSASGCSIEANVLPVDDLAPALGQAQALVLVAPDEIVGPTRDAVSAFLARGGGIAVFLDGKSNPLRVPGWERFLAASAELCESSSPSSPRPEEGAFEPAVARAISALSVSPGATLSIPRGANARVRLRDASGNPIWVDGPRSALLAFAPTGEDAALADEPAFPLLVKRVLRSALGEAALSPRQVGATVDLARDGGPTRAAFAVTPRGETLTLGESTTLSLGEPGVFRLVDSHGIDLSVFAARPDEQESALDRAPDAARSALASPERAPELASRARRDLAPPVQAAGLAFLLASCLLGNAARRSRAERKPGGEA